MLDDTDVDAVEGSLGTGVTTSRTITVTMGYRYSGSSSWSVDTDEAAAVVT